MEIKSAHYKIIEDLLPVQRGNVKLTNLQVLNAILSVAEQGCKWLALVQSGSLDRDDKTAAR